MTNETWRILHTLANNQPPNGNPFELVCDGVSPGDLASACREVIARRVPEDTAALSRLSQVLVGLVDLRHLMDRLEEEYKTPGLMAFRRVRDAIDELVEAQSVLGSVPPPRLFRARWVRVGAHIKCRIYEAPNIASTFACNGDLTFDEDSFPVFKALAEAMGMQFVEISSDPHTVVEPGKEWWAGFSYRFGGGTDYKSLNRALMPLRHCIVCIKPLAQDAFDAYVEDVGHDGDEGYGLLVKPVDSDGCLIQSEASRTIDYEHIESILLY